MKAVLDPNVLTASLLSRVGAPAKIILEWLNGAFELLSSPKLLEELEETLAYRRIQKRVTKDEGKNFITLLKLSGTATEDSSELPAIRSRDPDDDYLLALAVKESAVLVTGDKDLLDLNGTLPIYTPKQFLDLLQLNGESPSPNP